MAKRVFIVHGWSGSPDEPWIKWLKQCLEKVPGINVFTPVMPDTDNPKIDEWVNHLAKSVGTPDENTYFIGWSIGCQTVLRYLETRKNKVGGALFVAGWFKLTGLDTLEDREIARPWIYTEMNFERIKKVTKNFTAIFSDNDPFVPLEENVTIFKKELNSKIIIRKNKGHFAKDDGISEVPEVLEEILKMVK